MKLALRLALVMFPGACDLRELLLKVIFLGVFVLIQSLLKINIFLKAVLFSEPPPKMNFQV
jgi:hypothetical protein